MSSYDTLIILYMYSIIFIILQNRYCPTKNMKKNAIIGEVTLVKILAKSYLVNLSIICYTHADIYAST